MDRKDPNGHREMCAAESCNFLMDLAVPSTPTVRIIYAILIDIQNHTLNIGTQTEVRHKIIIKMHGKVSVSNRRAGQILQKRIKEMGTS